MRFTLLVIDDELESPVHAGAIGRRQYYERLSDRFDLVFLESAGDLRAELSKRVIHGVLLDFLLDGWGTTSANILTQLPPELPVGLISGHWGSDWEKLRGTLARFKGQVAQLFTWEDLENEERRELVMMWMNSSIASRRDIAITTIKPSEPLRILHLSDIQFEAEPPPKFNVETGLLAQRLHDAWGGPPTFIALTGDIAQHALPSEYRHAELWLKSLAHELDRDWDAERFLVVPGNHDVCWGLGRSARIQTNVDTLIPLLPKSTGGLYRELKPYALSPFRKFAQSLCGLTSWEDGVHQWTLGRYRHLGVVFCGIDTCQDLGEDSMPTRRLLDGTIADLFNGARAVTKDAGDPLLVGLMHHPLCGPASIEGVVNPDDFLGPLSQFSNAYVNLCGHVHTDICNLTSRNSAKILEVVAPTPTRRERDRPADTARGFNMIELSRNAGRVTGVTVTTCKFERSKLTTGETSGYVRDAKGRLVEADK